MISSSGQQHGTPLLAQAEQVNQHTSGTGRPMWPTFFCNPTTATHTSVLSSRSISLARPRRAAATPTATASTAHTKLSQSWSLYSGCYEIGSLTLRLLGSRDVGIPPTRVHPLPSSPSSIGQSRAHRSCQRRINPCLLFLCHIPVPAFLPNTSFYPHRRVGVPRLTDSGKVVHVPKTTVRHACIAPDAMMTPRHGLNPMIRPPLLSRHSPHLLFFYWTK